MFGNAEWAHKAVEEIDAKYKAVRENDKRRLEKLRREDQEVAAEERARDRRALATNEDV